MASLHLLLLLCVLFHANQCTFRSRTAGLPSFFSIIYYIFKSWGKASISARKSNVKRTKKSPSYPFKTRFSSLWAVMMNVLKFVKKKRHFFTLALKHFSVACRGSTWVPRYGWWGHSAVWCCSQVSSDSLIASTEMHQKRDNEHPSHDLSFLPGLLEAKSLLNAIKQEGNCRSEMTT